MPKSTSRYYLFSPLPHAALLAVTVMLLMWSLASPTIALAQENPDVERAANGITVICENAAALAFTTSEDLRPTSFFSIAQGDGVADLGDYYEARLGYELEFYAYICSCQYDNPEILPGDGYDSEQACLDAQVGEPGEIDKIASCARDVAAEAGEPPAWAADVTACHVDNYQSARQCLQALDAAGDCSQSTLGQVRQCHIMTFGESEGEDCDTHLQSDSPDPGWLTLVQDEIQRQCLN